MDHRQLYDDDIYAWSVQQAAVLRCLSELSSRLPNELDIEHVAEEIEDVGTSQRDAAESFARLMLVHLIKLAVSPASSAARYWRGEVVNFQVELLAELTPAMRGQIDLDRLWVQAKRQARAGLEEGEAADAQVWTFPRCPLDLAGLTDGDLDIDRTLSRFRAET